MKQTIEECERTGRPLPERIANTELLPGSEIYRDAFHELSTCRQFGMGVGPIPWTAIDTYASRHGYDPVQRHMLHQMLRQMDKYYLEHLDKKRERDRVQRDAASASKRRRRGKFGKG